MMQTVINWRPYPEQKPDAEGWHTCMRNGFACRERYDAFLGFPYGVTHFALPEDIHTGEPK